MKWVEKWGEEMELGELKEKKMVKAMEQVADRIENLVEGQEELIEQQRSTGLGVEKMLRVIEGKDRKWEEEREREREEKMKQKRRWKMKSRQIRSRIRRRQWRGRKMEMGM